MSICYNNFFSNRRLRGLVLDLDGTLIDSAPDLTRAVNRGLAAHERPALGLDAVRRMIGDGLRKLTDRALAATGGDTGVDPDAFEREVFDAYMHPRGPVLTRVYPGVLATMKGLRRQGMRLGVATNKPDEAAWHVLDEMRLAPLVDGLVGGDAAPARKPDGRHVAAVLNALALPREQAAMVGDGPNDALAGRRAGLPVVLVAYGYRPVPASTLGAQRVIQRFSELPQALAGLRRR